MTQSAEKLSLQPALERARKRWLNAAMINAGSRWAALPALAVLGAALAFALAGWRDFVLLAVLSALGLCGVAAALLLTRQAFARPRRVGAPDWSLQLDRELGLNDALVTLLDGAGPFAKAVQARVASGFDEAKARKAAPRKHWGALVIALLLALMPLALWSPQPRAPQDDAVANVAPENAQRRDVQPSGAPAKGDAGGGKAKKSGSQGNGGESATADPGETRASQPAPSGRASDKPGEAPPSDVKPTPAEGSSKERGIGDNKGPKPPEAEQPEKTPESAERPITPEAGEGERRSRETSKHVYDPDGERKPGVEGSGPNWKEKAEDVIPRMKLTSRERKMLEEWFNKVGR
ncbi:MAG: hypothetical protein IT461_09305 [Planctomycetes bacterium]|jgi:hypothetical protein|nr:hypothetical protein [Planctomycetota bacterium]